VSSSTIDLRERLQDLGRLLEANPEVDLIQLDLTTSEGPASLRWPSLDHGRDEVLEALLGYQRLLRTVPRAPASLVMALLGRGLHSAVHIAAMAQARFVEEYAELFAGDREWAREAHEAALARRAELTLHYLRARQGLEQRARPLSTHGAKD